MSHNELLEPKYRICPPEIEAVLPPHPIEFCSKDDSDYGRACMNCNFAVPGSFRHTHAVWCEHRKEMLQCTEVTRPEDMSPDGSLTLFKQDDGDIIVTVQGGGDDFQVQASAEFCLSGGHSPKTLAALRLLMLAMQEDARA